MATEQVIGLSHQTQSGCVARIRFGLVLILTELYFAEVAHAVQ